VLRKRESTQQQHFLNFNEDMGLTFQFLLAEFIQAMQEVRFLEIQLERYLQETADTFQGLIYPLTELCGGTMHSLLLFSWDSDDGTLHKLNKYVHLLSQKEEDNKEIKDLQNTLEKGLKEAMSGLRLLREAEKEQTSLYLRDSIEKHLRSAIRCLKKLSKCVSSLLYRFKKDENVLFFLLRYQGSFKEIYGKRFLLRFFEVSCPGGVKSIERFLLAEYNRRGFGHLSQNINEKLVQLNA